MRNSNSAIGGYFELEISDRGNLYHNDAVALNSGRNGFEYILKCKKYKRVHIPYFTCDIMLQSVKKLDIEFCFYHIDETFKPVLSDYHEEDALLYTNYYGLNQYNIKVLAQQFKHIIIDNAQAFFDYPLYNIPTFYSPRKFFGLPDGGFVYGANEISSDNYEVDCSLDRMMQLLIRIEKGAESGYNLFKSNEAKLYNQPIKRMSALTRKILNGINFHDVLERRMNNFNYIHEALKKTNQLSMFIGQSQATCPMIYPYWIDNGNETRKLLVKNKIYSAIYWPGVLDWVDNNTVEFEFINNIVYIPIDQRLSIYELDKIISVLNR